MFDQGENFKNNKNYILFNNREIKFRLLRY